MTGYTVVLVDSSNAKNGKTVNGRKAIGEFNSTKGEIVLDIGSDNVVATALHEVTHYAKINAPTQYNALRDAVLEHTTKSGKMKYYLEKYSNTYRTNNVYEITEEMTADAAEALLTNEKFISELLSDKSFVNAVVGENKGFVRKFLDTLHDIINSIKDYLKGRTVNHQIARELSEDVKALEKIEKLWRDALKAAVDNHAESSNTKENTDTQSNGVKYSLKEYTEHQKENWKDSKQIIVYENENQLRNFIQKSLDGEYLSAKKKLYFGAISTDLAERIFNETGVDAENYNITISSNEIRKILLNSHGDEKKENLRGQRAITEDDILAIPKIIEEADFIELDRKKYDGKPIIRFIKTINGRTTVVSYVSQKKHDLGVQTMYSSIKKDSLVTAANAKALTETSETTSNTAIFNTTISQSDSDVNSSIHGKEKNNTKFSITEDMSEQERYEELKDKSIVVSKPDMSKVSDIDIEAYKNLSTKEAKKPIRRIAEMLGIHNVNYKNSNTKFDFAFSKGSLDTSLNHQREYGGSYTDYAEMLTCLDKLVENAELIEVHKNYKGNKNLKKTYVLISAFSDKSNVVPVQLEVKNFENQPNGLYLNVVLSKIKESAVIMESFLGSTTDSTPLVADSAISLSQLFANVNPTDKRFLKYVPDNFLSTEQIEAKREAQKSDYKNYNRYVEVFENDKDDGNNKFSLSEPVEKKIIS